MKLLRNLFLTIINLFKYIGPFMNNSHIENHSKVKYNMLYMQIFITNAH